jgi:predicted nucleic acid-binding protein/predicted HTH domain antitoxin
MSVLISDETLRACQMEAAEFKQEIALLLFQAGRLTIGHASHLAQMPPNAFRELLKQRHIPLYVYDVEDFRARSKKSAGIGSAVIVISDTSVFTNLAAIGHLHLLQQLYERIFIPTAVYQELTVDPPVPGTVEVQTLQWLEVRSVSDRAMVEQLQNRAQLDPGESEAIALALEINADLLLIDERRGRTEANRLGIRITGLLGVLVEAKQR